MFESEFLKSMQGPKEMLEELYSQMRLKDKPIRIIPTRGAKFYELGKNILPQVNDVK